MTYKIYGLFKLSNLHDDGNQFSFNYVPLFWQKSAKFFFYNLFFAQWSLKNLHLSPLLSNGSRMERLSRWLLDFVSPMKSTIFHACHSLHYLCVFINCN